MTLSWLPPSTGAPIGGYAIGVGWRPETLDAGVFDLGAVTTFTTTAAPGVYFARVAATNGCGVGAPSNEQPVVVGPPIPGPPTALGATITTAGLVTLTWQAPTAGGAVSQYVVEAGSGPGLANLASVPTGSATPSFATTAAAGRYYVRVRAVNAYGSSVASEEIILQVG